QPGMENPLSLDLTADRALFLYRCVEFSSGASPLLPAVFMSAMFCAWAFFHLKRRHLAERFSTPSPFPDLPDPTPLLPLRRIALRHDDLVNDLMRSTDFMRRQWPAVVCVFLVVCGGATRLWNLYLYPPEHMAWGTWFFFGFSVGYLLISLVTVRFWASWVLLRSLLSQIALLPLTGSFDRLPSKVKLLF